MAKWIHPYHIVLLSSKKRSIPWYKNNLNAYPDNFKRLKKKPVPKNLHTIMITSMQHTLNDKIIAMEDRLVVAKS